MQAGAATLENSMEVPPQFGVFCFFVFWMFSSWLGSYLTLGRNSREVMPCPSRCITPCDTWCQFVPSLAMFTLVPWLRWWCVQSFSTAKLLFARSFIPWFLQHLLVGFLLSGRAFPFQGEPCVNGLLKWPTCGSPRCRNVTHIPSSWARRWSWPAPPSLLLPLLDCDSLFAIQW